MMQPRIIQILKIESQLFGLGDDGVVYISKFVGDPWKKIVPSLAEQQLNGGIEDYKQSKFFNNTTGETK